MKHHKKTPCEGDAGRHLAEGLDEPCNSLSAFHSRLDRYSSARSWAYSMVKHLEPDHHIRQLSKEYKALRSCGSYLLFRHYFTVDEYRLAALKSCKKHLLCPLCALRRGSKNLTAYLQRYEAIRAENPDLRPYMVTMAIKNGDDLKERFDHLNASLRKLFQRRRDARKGRPTPSALQFVDGAVWTFEVSNQGKGWHPHVHMIALAKWPPDQRALRDEWESITGDSWTCDVSRKEGQTDLQMFMEAFKYAVKFGDLSLEQTIHVYRTLRGRRLIASMGSFRSVKVPPDNTDEQLDDHPYVDLLYKFAYGKGYYLANVSKPVNPGGSPPPKGRVYSPPNKTS